MKLYIYTLFLFPLILFSQTNITGKVLDKQTPLIGANVKWINTNIGVSTNSEGKFKIIKENITDNRLIISFIGFKNDTISINESSNNLTIRLNKSSDLNTVNLKEDVEGIYIDKKKPIKTEIITKEELTKAACCDLAGCFETQISVEPKTTNIITNTKEIGILGLSGVYNQLLVDNLPIMNGLNFTYGVSAIPGTLINNIYISQGLASVQQGSESITGQINIELKEPSEEEKLFLNLYINSFSAKQANINYNFKIGNWRSIVSLHTTQPGREIDNNNDDFLDLPLTTKYSLYNKWIYGDKNNIGLYSVITLRYLNEQRIGGQIGYTEKDQGSNSIYGQTINFSQPELHFKSTYKLNERNYLISRSAITHHKQESFFGTTQYLADQLNYFTDLSYKLNWNTHELWSGLNLRKTDINETINLNDNFNRSFGGDYKKNENITGFYIENIFNWNDKKLQLISGLRLDQHNNHGLFFTPRCLIKYNFSENTTMRASIGKGWRTINLFSENIKLFGTNRDIIISDDLKAEEALNYGLNLLHAIYLENIELQFIFDAYKTNFSNQVHPHYHTNDNSIYVHNLVDASTSNSLQGEFAIELYETFGAKIAYNYLDVYRIEHGHKHRLPFTSKHHILSTLSYKPIKENWHFDCNLHWFGKKKLIDTSQNPEPYNRNKTSDPYSTINAQFTKKFEKMDLYVGVENILNFKQENPIISWEDPFGEYFNIANVWGPTKGREVYLGLRYKL